MMLARTRGALFSMMVAGATATASLGACHGGGDQGTGGSSSSSSSGAGGSENPLIPAPAGLRRLVGAQYVNTVRLIFGDAAAAVAKPPPDEQLHGLDAIGASELALSPDAVTAYETSAREIAKAIVADASGLQKLLLCTPTAPIDMACFTKLVTNVGHLAWRRPLTPDEVKQVVAAAVEGAKVFGTFEAGVVNAVSALLQSPNFIYIVEIGAPDPADPTHRKLTPNELAARMSFFLLGETPDSDLLEQAEIGQLAKPDDIRKAARRLLGKPEAKAALEAFYAELFRTREIPDVAKNAKLHPEWDDALKSAVQQETMQLLDDIVWTRNADFRELFTADYTFVNKPLAELYAIDPPKDDAFHKVPMPPGQDRAGFLGQASFLAKFSHPATTSPTRRGLFVKTVLLCTDIPPPPPGVNQNLPQDPNKPKTMRQLLEDHVKNPTCAACHVQMDPIGISLEKFDEVGSYRTLDNGLPIDSKETVPGIGSFASPKELGQALAKNPAMPLCVVRNTLQQAMGHMVTDGELVAVYDLAKTFTDSGYKMQDLLVEITASPDFQWVGEPK